jgi:hypothetical protein
MSWSFRLARSWEEAYGDQLLALQQFARSYGTRAPDWNARCDEPPVLGMQLPYALAPTMEDFLQGWLRRRVTARVDLLPFPFDLGDPLAYELTPDWLVLPASCITDGSRYSYDDAHQLRVDQLAPRFTGAIPESDDEWEIAAGALEKRMFELAHAAYDIKLPVLVYF